MSSKTASRRTSAGTRSIFRTLDRSKLRPERECEYIGTNDLLLGLIMEHITSQPIAEVLRGGVLNGDGYKRPIYQPDEQPTDPMWMPGGASADTFDENGGYLPSLANAT